tara:strand:- start:750 stop:953 length:204 start_codon:yes stop_codon:yes gene_type:complete
MTNKKSVLKVSCPSCKTQLLWEASNPHRPFCSGRCRQLDFCGWANEEKVLEGESLYDEIFSIYLEKP